MRRRSRPTRRGPPGRLGPAADPGAGLALARREVETFRRERGYTPPYWELVRLAREAAASAG